jgi:rubrerythrin
VTTRFRVETVKLETTNGPVDYEFRSDLTVLAGPTGVGKTTLLELIKFGFGGDATLADVAVLHIESVTLQVRIGDHRLQISRSLDQAKRKTVRVFDMIDQQRLRDHRIDDKQPSLNTLLLECFGLRDDLRAAAGGNSTRAGARITFADIFTYMYVPQSQINRDIAHSHDTYREPKRRAVFELLFGLVDADILALRSEVSKLKGDIAEAETRHATVVQFLRDSGTDSRDHALAAQAHATEALAEAQRQLADLRETIDPVLDRETQTLRDLLTEAERGLTDSRAAAVDLTRRQAQNNAERARVQADLARLNRMRDAGERLADIEFTVCPRCMQSIKKRQTPPGSCRLCLQPDPVSTPPSHDQYEAQQLTEQLTEMYDQDSVLADQHAAAMRLTDERERLISHLAKMLEERTSHRITPRLQAFTDVSSQAATATADQERWETILRQWDSVSDLEAAAKTLRIERENARSSLDAATRALDERRTEIIAEISEEFDAAVRAIGIPGIVDASIDDQNYLPVINGKVFSSKNQLAGGITTATQIAYWCSLLTVAMRRRDTIYPRLLLIDSPRLALNTAVQLAGAMYSRLTTQANARPGELQLIIADNELPDSYRGGRTQIDFDYDRPTVSTIEHPGPARVSPISTVELEDV